MAAATHIYVLTTTYNKKWEGTYLFPVFNGKNQGNMQLFKKMFAALAQWDEWPLGLIRQSHSRERTATTSFVPRPSHRPVFYYILQAIKNWTVGRPGNKANTVKTKW